MRNNICNSNTIGSGYKISSFISSIWTGERPVNFRIIIISSEGRLYQSAVLRIFYIANEELQLFFVLQPEVMQLFLCVIAAVWLFCFGTSGFAVFLF